MDASQNVAVESVVGGWAYFVTKAPGATLSDGADSLIHRQHDTSQSYQLQTPKCAEM